MKPSSTLYLTVVVLATLLLLALDGSSLEAAGKRRLLRRAQVSPMSLVATQDGYWFSESGQQIMFYQRVTKSQQGKWPRSNYIHPLFDLDCNEVT